MLHSHNQTQRCNCIERSFVEIVLRIVEKRQNGKNIDMCMNNVKFDT